MSKISKNAAPHWLWVLVAVGVLTQTAANLVRPVTTYKLMDLGWGELEIGLATASYAVLPLFLALPFGRLQMKLSSSHNFVALAAAITASGAAYLALTSQIVQLMIASAILGVGHIMFSVGAQSMIASRSRPSQMDTNFGWFTAAFSVGQMLGPLLLGIILGNVSSTEAASASASASINLALWIGAVSALVAVPILYSVRMTPNQRIEISKKSDNLENIQKPSAVRILRVAGVPSHMLAAMSFLVILDVIIAFMPLVGEAYGVSPMVVGALLAVRGLTSFISRIFIGYLSSRVSRNVLVLVALFVSAASIAAVPVSLSMETFGTIVAFILIALGGFTLGLGQPLTMTMVSQAVPVSWQGPALALRMVGTRLGQVVLPLAASAFAGSVGPAGALWFGCAILGISGLERIVNKRTGPNLEES